MDRALLLLFALGFCGYSTVGGTSCEDAAGCRDRPLVGLVGYNTVGGMSFFLCDLLLGFSLLALSSSSANSSSIVGPGRTLGILSDLACAFALALDRDLSLVAGSTGAAAGTLFDLCCGAGSTGAAGASGLFLLVVVLFLSIVALTRAISFFLSFLALLGPGGGAGGCGGPP